LQVIESGLFGSSLLQIQSPFRAKRPGFIQFPLPVVSLYTRSRACLGKASGFFEKAHILFGSHRSCTPARKRVSFVMLSLCLSRACLGKKIICIYKWRKKPVFSPRAAHTAECSGAAASAVAVKKAAYTRRPCLHLSALSFSLICVLSLSWQTITFATIERSLSKREWPIVASTAGRRRAALFRTSHDHESREQRCGGGLQACGCGRPRSASATTRCQRHHHCRYHC
jgi:hypothetical protein